jgi:spore coat polysaccharide biosynthesis protein SpsF (cytidylyltransferase family)
MARPLYGDTVEDLHLVREIYKRFGGRDDFSWLEVVALIARYPELAAINASVAHKTVHDVDVRH